MFGIGAHGVVGGLLADRMSQRLLNVIGLVVFMVSWTLIFGMVRAPQGVEMFLTLLLGSARAGMFPSFDETSGVGGSTASARRRSARLSEVPRRGRGRGTQ
jgi:MFS family permease